MKTDKNQTLNQRVKEAIKNLVVIRGIQNQAETSKEENRGNSFPTTVNHNILNMKKFYFFFGGLFIVFFILLILESSKKTIPNNFVWSRNNFVESIRLFRQAEQTSLALDTNKDEWFEPVLVDLLTQKIDEGIKHSYNVSNDFLDYVNPFLRNKYREGLIGFYKAKYENLTTSTDSTKKREVKDALLIFWKSFYKRGFGRINNKVFIDTNVAPDWQVEVKEFYYPYQYYALGQSLKNKGEYFKAIQCFEFNIKQTKKENEKFQSISQIGEIYYLKECYELAISYFTEAINSQSGFSTYYYYRGMSYLSLGFYSLAISDFMSVALIKIGEFTIWNWLILIFGLVLSIWLSFYLRKELMNFTIKEVSLRTFEKIKGTPKLIKNLFTLKSGIALAILIVILTLTNPNLSSFKSYADIDIPKTKVETEFPEQESTKRHYRRYSYWLVCSVYQVEVCEGLIGEIYDGKIYYETYQYYGIFNNFLKSAKTDGRMISIDN